MNDGVQYTTYSALCAHTLYINWYALLFFIVITQKLTFIESVFHLVFASRILQLFLFIYFYYSTDWIKTKKIKIVLCVNGYSILWTNWEKEKKLIREKQNNVAKRSAFYCMNCNEQKKITTKFKEKEIQRVYLKKN